jgi:hypothetical protein
VPQEGNTKHARVMRISYTLSRDTTDDLATVTKNGVRFVQSNTETILVTKPTPLQQRALDLLQVSLRL